MKKPVVLSLLLLSAVSVIYFGYRSWQGPGRYESLIRAEIARLGQEENPLCASLLGVEQFPYTAALRRPPGSSVPDEAAPPPQDLISGQRWRDLVAAGLVTETEYRGPDRLLTGYTYRLTAKGRALYSQRQLTRDEKTARFCLGKPELRQVVRLAKPAPRGGALEIPARFQWQVRQPRPELTDGTAQALGIVLSEAAEDGGVLVLPEVNAVFVLDAKGEKVMRVRRESLL